VANLCSMSKTVEVFVTPHFHLKCGCIGEWRMRIKSWILESLNPWMFDSSWCFF